MMKRLAIILTIVAFAFCYAPPPKPSTAQFGGQALWAPSPSTGSVNAQSVALANYNLDVGVLVTFTVGTALNNTGPTNLNINGTGVVQVRRQTNVGSFELVGGEFVAANQVAVIYDGSVYKLVGQVYQVGVSINQRGTTVDPGWQIEDGSCFSSTAPTYAALFARIGAQYGNCGAGTFRVPDARGTIDAALDNQGVNGAANKITAAGCGNVFTSIPALCGSQVSSLTSVNQMPPYTPAGGVSTSTTVTNQGNLGGVYVPSNLAPDGFSVAAGSVRIQALSASSTSAFTGTPVGSSAAFPVLNPVFGTLRAIKL